MTALKSLRHNSHYVKKGGTTSKSSFTIARFFCKEDIMVILTGVQRNEQAITIIWICFFAILAFIAVFFITRISAIRKNRRIANEKAEKEYQTLKECYSHLTPEKIDACADDQLPSAVILECQRKEEADEDHPIFLVKMASNGSGFAQSGTQYNWPFKDENGEFPEINLYDTFAKPFLENNLKLIEDMGLKPVIKGWVWHQGESDCDGGVNTQKYAERLGDMVGKFREDFADYARDEDGDNIAFIDGMVYQGSGSAWTKPEDMNAKKQEFADSGDNNFLVDIYGNEEAIPENELKPGSPGGDSMHYNTKSSLRLGMAYGKVILENNLLD